MSIYVPSHCPSCNGILSWNDNHVDLLCENPLCPAQVLYRIEYFLRTLGVEELTGVTLEKFKLNSILDVYSLNEDFILSLDGFQERKAHIIMSQIKNSINEVHISKLIAAFGIPNIGLKNAEKIINFIKRIKKEEDSKILMNYFFEIDADELLLIEGLGVKIINNISLYRNKFRDLYHSLLELGLTFKSDTTGPLQNINIVMTGASPDGTKRPVLEKMIEEYGGINGKSISKSTNLLVCDDLNSNSSKMKKARDLNVEIITYDEFFNRLKNI